MRRKILEIFEIFDYVVNIEIVDMEIFLILNIKSFIKQLWSVIRQIILQMTKKI